jgi:hypothetical protein
VHPSLVHSRVPMFPHHGRSIVRDTVLRHNESVVDDRSLIILVFSSECRAHRLI